MIRRSSSLVLHFFATTPGSLLVSPYATTFQSIEYSNSLKAELHNCDGWETKQKKKNHTGHLRRRNLTSLHDITLSVYNLSFSVLISWFECSDTANEQSLRNPFHIETVSTSAFIVHTRLLAKAHLHFAHLLLMSLAEEQSIANDYFTSASQKWMDSCSYLKKWKCKRAISYSGMQDTHA